jgi:hypothetical protein
VPYGFIQPVLTWNWNFDGTQVEEWEVSAWAYDQINGWSTSGGYSGVSTNDTINAVMDVESNGEWYIRSNDTTSGAYAYLYYTPYYTSDWNYMFAEVLEAYDDGNQDDYPHYCDDLPASKSEDFYIVQADQLDHGEVTPDLSLQSIAYAEEPSGCNWGQTYGVVSGGTYNGYQYAKLTW